ncbi:MAG: SgcJ/EcaC family oxidoreductase [Candidatus Obscuribacterales bacterium]|nr:SgcJ/EcaC family oxidoreductase [Candidatus Obscuribacterales bacterium]
MNKHHLRLRNFESGKWFAVIGGSLLFCSINPVQAEDVRGLTDDSSDSVKVLKTAALVAPEINLSSVDGKIYAATSASTITESTTGDVTFTANGDVTTGGTSSGNLFQFATRDDITINDPIVIGADMDMHAIDGAKAFCIIVLATRKAHWGLSPGNCRFSGRRGHQRLFKRQKCCSISMFSAPSEFDICSILIDRTSTPAVFQKHRRGLNKMIANKMPKAAVVALSLGVAALCFAANAADAKSTGKAEKKNKTASAKQLKSDGSSQTAQAAVHGQLFKITKALSDVDAKAMAALWTEDGTYVDEDGAVFKGRAAVQDCFTEAFKEGGKPQLELVNDSLRLLSDSVALSEGVVRIKAKGTSETRYSIVFVKQNGTWLISSATETPMAAAAEVNPLEQLAWLVGDWTGEKNGGTVQMKAEWAANKNFITCTYETKKSNDGKPVQSRQVIGWDPRNDQPISWNFDSNGGFGLGLWVKNGKRWEIAVSGVERDGSTSSATNVMSVDDSNGFVWQSLNRSVDGVAFTDTAPLKIRRAAK